MNSNNVFAIEFRRKVRRIGLCAGLAVMMAWLVIAGVGAAIAQERTPFKTHVVTALARSEEPIVITGTRLPVFVGVPLNELVVYAERGGEWSPIPFQIDEVNISGTYVISDDGLLGNKDEIGLHGSRCKATVPARPLAG
jgi:hypothetical protein